MCVCVCVHVYVYMRACVHVCFFFFFNTFSLDTNQLNQSVRVLMVLCVLRAIN